MSTQKDTVAYILETLGNDTRFTTRALFGEYALYADGRVVALICDDLLYVKITPQSEELETFCEKDSPYEGAKLHYLIEENQLHEIENLPSILCSISHALPPAKPKKKKLSS